jgi:hypothetical protein
MVAALVFPVRLPRKQIRSERECLAENFGEIHELTCGNCVSAKLRPGPARWRLASTYGGLTAA